MAVFTAILGGRFYHSHFTADSREAHGEGEGGCCVSLGKGNGLGTGSHKGAFSCKKNSVHYP